MNPGNPEAAPAYHQFFQPVVSGNGQQYVSPSDIPDVFKAQTPLPQVVHVVQAELLRDKSTQLKCPKCKAEIQTRVKYETGRMTYIAAALICAVGCLYGCCLIPFCIESCKDVQHECTRCNYFIGRYRR